MTRPAGFIQANMAGMRPNRDLYSMGRGQSPPAPRCDAHMGYRLGIDVGGTFTDLVLFSEESGTWLFPVPPPCPGAECHA